MRPTFEETNESKEHATNPSYVGMKISEEKPVRVTSLPKALTYFDLKADLKYEKFNSIEWVIRWLKMQEIVSQEIKAERASDSNCPQTVENSDGQSVKNTETTSKPDHLSEDFSVKYTKSSDNNRKSSVCSRNSSPDTADVQNMVTDHKINGKHSAIMETIHEITDFEEDKVNVSSLLSKYEDEQNLVFISLCFENHDSTEQMNHSEHPYIRGALTLRKC